MVSLLSYGCSTSAGIGVTPFWESLQAGISHAKPASLDDWPVIPSPIPLVCAWSDEIKSRGAKETLVTQLMEAWQEASLGLRAENFENLGIILASTKGELEDFIWKPTPDSMGRDPLTPVLEAFIQRAGLKPKRSLCASNACASSHAALFLAKKWIDSGTVNQVLVLAADFIGPFVVNGFQALKALAANTTKPFSRNRDGLMLGDAAAALILSGIPESSLEIENIAIDNEGYAVTRPAEDGASLKRIFEKIVACKNRPDFVIAHGTGTIENDKIEDRALSETFEMPFPPVTAAKWCIGHTLGASGAMDLIAAALCLKEKKLFSIANTDDVDPHFRMPYLCREGKWRGAKPLKRALVNSLGFGGTHSALLLSIK